MNTFYNDVNEWLSVGGDISLAQDLTGQSYTETIAQLRDHGVTHVLDLRLKWEVRNDHALWADAGVPAANVLNVPINDSWGYIPPEEWFATVEAFVQNFWLDSFEGDRLYVHCHMGINRGPSAAMLALLTVDPLLNPLDAFLQVRSAREAAGIVYGEAVGIRHLLNVEGIDLGPMDELPVSVTLWSHAVNAYWTPELRQSVNQGIAFYRDAERGTRAQGSLLDRTV